MHVPLFSVADAQLYSLLRPPPLFSSLIFIGCPCYRPELFLSFMCAIISPLSLYIQFTHHLLHHLFVPSSASPITLTRLTLTLIRLTLHPQGHCSHSLKTQLHYHFSFHHHCPQFHASWLLKCTRFSLWR